MVAVVVGGVVVDAVIVVSVIVVSVVAILAVGAVGVGGVDVAVVVTVGWSFSINHDLSVVLVVVLRSLVLLVLLYRCYC